MKEFTLNNQEYIQLNNLLKVNDLVGTGGEAKVRIQNGEVLVNGEVELQVRKKIRVGDVVEMNGEQVKVVGE